MIMKQKFVKAALAACCAAAVGCVEAPVAAGPEHYAVQTVATSDREIPVYYSATVRGRQDIDIYPQISGTVSELCITEGQQVDEGQTLFIIDQVPYKAALQTAEANVVAAKAGVSTAKLVRDSKKQLFRRKVVSQFDLSSAQNQLLTAEAQLAQAEAQRVSAANNLSYTVGPSAKLTTVSDNSEMYIYFSMTENQLLNLTRRYGSTAATLQNMPDVQLQLSDGSLYDHSGRVESISGVIDASTGSVQLRAAFPNKNGLLHSGGSGNIILPSVYKDCIVIPQTATFEIQDKVYVYKVIDGKASSAMIDVEKVTNGREYIVRSGLEPGETIVAEGVGLLREGTPIVPKQPQAEVEAEAETVPDAQTAKEE